MKRGSWFASTAICRTTLSTCCSPRDITDLAISANLQFEVEGRKPKTKGITTLIQHSISPIAEIGMVYLSFERFQSWDLQWREEKDENDECISETPSALLLFKVWLEGKYYYLLFNLRERLYRVSFLEIMSLEIRKEHPSWINYRNHVILKWID